MGIEAGRVTTARHVLACFAGTLGVQLAHMAEQVAEAVQREARRLEDYQKGGRNGNAKLTVRDVRRIRARLPNGGWAERQGVLAEDLGVSIGAIKNVRSGANWKDVR